MITFDPKEYWENRLRSTFGLNGVGYTGLGKHYNNLLYKVRRFVFLHRIKSTCQDFSGANVLDVGCGTGFYIEMWEELGVKNIVGIDLANVAIKNLKQKYTGHKFYQIDIGSIGIGSLMNHKFDAISAFDVLFHIVDDTRYEQAINNIYSLLKPGGFFIWSDNFLHEDVLRTAHQVSRTLKNIERIVVSTGFQIVERRPMFYLMNAPVDTRSRLRQLLWRFIGFIVSRGEIAGLAIGSALLPLELILTSMTNEGPSTEMMVCKKPA